MASPKGKQPDLTNYEIQSKETIVKSVNGKTHVHGWTGTKYVKVK